jgi:hypothetical protein
MAIHTAGEHDIGESKPVRGSTARRPRAAVRRFDHTIDATVLPSRGSGVLMMACQR